MTLTHRIERMFEMKGTPVTPLPKADVIAAIGCSLAPDWQAGPQTYEIACLSAELYRAGAAPKVALIGSGYKPGQMPTTEAQQMYRICYNYKVPSEVCVLEGNSFNTRENALAFARLAEQHGWQSVILVAQQLHARRVYLAFRKVLGPDFPIHVIKAHSIYGGSSKWFLNSFWAFLLWDTLSLAYFKVRGWI